MDILVLKFLHSFASNKLNQTRCIDPFIWSRIFDYTGQEIKKFSKQSEVKKWVFKIVVKHIWKINKKY